MDGLETVLNNFTESEETSSLNIDDFKQIPLVVHQMFVVEIPSFIAVETRFITPQMANQKEILIFNATTISPETVDYEANTQKKDAGLMVEPSTDHVSVQTDTPTLKRHRGQQATNIRIQIDVGIQCSWENYSNFDVEQADTSPSDEFNENEYYEFFKFVQKHTNLYSNSKEECLVCGEICTNSKQILSHMTTHWGPPALCEICGEQLEHTSLLLLHKCKIMSKRKNKRIVHQQCPIYSCGLMTESKWQLNDHISKHLDLALNRCFTCKRIFQRRYKMQNHSAAKKKISPRPRHFKNCGIHKKHSLLSQYLTVVKTRLRWNFRYMNRCQICLVKCLNPSLFANHRRKCVKYFRNRLELTRTRTPKGLKNIKKIILSKN